MSIIRVGARLIFNKDLFNNLEKFRTNIKERLYRKVVVMIE